METTPIKHDIFTQLSRMAINGPNAKAGIALWANECCVADVRAAMSGSTLYASYVKWATAQGAPVCTDRMFLIDLGKQGVPKTMRNGKRIWLGLQVKPEWMPDGGDAPTKDSYMDATALAVGDWLATRCDTSVPGAAEWADDMYADFVDWAHESIGPVAFGIALKKMPEVVAHPRQMREVGDKTVLRTQYTGLSLLNGKRKSELAKPVMAALADVPPQERTRPAWMDLAPHQMTEEQRAIWRREVSKN